MKLFVKFFECYSLCYSFVHFGAIRKQIVMHTNVKFWEHNIVIFVFGLHSFFEVFRLKIHLREKYLTKYVHAILHLVNFSELIVPFT